MNGFELTDLQLPQEAIFRGGVPRDGIPAIHHPQFVEAPQADFLQPHERVLGVRHRGVAKAYPIDILEWHEVVNDSYGGRAVVLTYCPLCGSGVAFDGRPGGKARTFGVSGLLYNSDVLLYDRETESLWSQLRMEAVSGPASGTPLQPLPTEQTTWTDWRQQYPETRVLSPNTGHDIDYTRDPYARYEHSGQLMFPVARESDAYPKKEKVLGVRYQGRALAFPFSELRQSEGRIEVALQDLTLEVTYDPETQSARLLNEDVPAFTLYWFAWYAFYPDSQIYKARLGSFE